MCDSPPHPGRSSKPPGVSSKPNRFRGWSVTRKMRAHSVRMRRRQMATPNRLTQGPLLPSVIPVGMSSWKCSVTTGVDIPVFKNRRVHVYVCVYDQMAVAQRKFITPRLWAGGGGRGKPVLGGQGGAPTAEGSKVKMPVAQTPCDPGHCSPPGSSAHGIVQARVLERVASPAAD